MQLGLDTQILIPGSRPTRIVCGFQGHNCGTRLHHYHHKTSLPAAPIPHSAALLRPGTAWRIDWVNDKSMQRQPGQHLLVSRASMSSRSWSYWQQPSPLSAAAAECAIVKSAPDVALKPSRAGPMKKLKVAPVYLRLMLGGCAVHSHADASRDTIQPRALSIPVSTASCVSCIHAGRLRGAFSC